MALKKPPPSKSVYTNEKIVAYIAKREQVFALLAEGKTNEEIKIILGL